MFAEPEKRVGWGLLWWVVAFSLAMAIVEMFMREWVSAAFNGVLAIYLAVQAATEGRPLGVFRVAHWSLVGLLAVLLVTRIVSWTRL